MVPEHHINDLLKIPDCHLLQAGSPVFFGLHFDSRCITPGQGFIARKGSLQDGHEFVSQAVAQGASLILCEHAVSAPANVTVIECQDPYKVLREYAKVVRSRFTAPVIGITGSVGKTSTKHFLKTLLGRQAFASAGNFNNLVGLPICVLQAETNSSHIVLEMGISYPGEMAELAAIARPDIMIITMIANSHRENFSSLQQLQMEKLACIRELTKGAMVLAPSDHRQAILDLRSDVQFVPIDTSIAKELLPLQKSLGQGPLQSLNIAWQLASRLIDGENLFSRLSQLKPAHLRMERRMIAGVEWILDCYNAAPASMARFLESCMDEGPGLMVLADMKELGVDALEAHKATLAQAVQLKDWSLVLLGQMFAQAAKELNLTCTTVNNKEEILPLLKSNRFNKIALKGSRSFALETLCSTN